MSAQKLVYVLVLSVLDGKSCDQSWPYSTLPKEKTNMQSHFILGVARKEVFSHMIFVCVLNFFEQNTSAKILGSIWSVTKIVC